MGDRRRSPSGWPNHSRSSNSNGKPPRPPCSSSSSNHFSRVSYTVLPAALEKRFCTWVCSDVPWWKICYAKFLISNHKNIANWDDSGALEAFQNAKARFLAQGDDIPPPDPDMYIDNVDYDAAVDPDLVADLENNQPPPPGGGCIIFADQPIPGTGWGDAAECSADTQNNNNGAEPFSSGWDSKPNRGIDTAGGSGNAWNNYNSWGDNSWDIGKNCSPGGNRENKNNNSSGQQRRKGRKKRDGSHFGFRSMKRPRMDNYQMNDNSHWLYDKQPLAMQ